MSWGEAVIILSMNMFRMLCTEKLVRVGRAVYCSTWIEVGEKRFAVWSADEGHVSTRKREGASRVKMKNVVCDYRSDVG